MSLSTAPGAYADCYDIFNKALEDGQGVRAELPDYNSAIHFRMRMQMARNLERKENAKTYPTDHPMHNRSAWDMFVIKIKTNGQGRYWIYVEPVGMELGEVEALSTVDDDDVMVIKAPKAIDGPPPVLQLEHFKRRF